MHFVVLGAFVNVSLLHELGAKLVELVQLMHKFVPKSWIKIFRNERNLPHCTLNSCFGAFHCISVHLAMFRYYTELGIEWVELVQLMKKFVPRNRIEIFGNERTRSIPLDPKLMFWCVFIVFGCICQCLVTT